MGMDLKFLVGIVFGLYGAGFTLAIRRPRVYDQISNTILAFIVAFTTMAVGLYLGASWSKDAIGARITKDFPSATVEAAAKLLEPADKLSDLALSMAWSGGAVFLGHMVFVVLALLADHDDGRKTKQRID